MKVYVITISEVDDACDYYHKPQVFETHEKATAHLEKLKAEVDEQFPTDYKREFTETCIEVYKDGEYSTDHWNAVIHEVEVQ